MKFLWMMVLVVLASVALAQEGTMAPPAPPAELKQVEWLLGDFSGELNMTMGPEPMKMRATVKTTRVLGGMHFQSMNTMTADPSYSPLSTVSAMKIEGIFMLTYDAMKKQFQGYWFDNSAPGGMVMEGKLEGDKLVLTSKPVRFEGMPGEVIMRSTYTKMANGQVGFLLEQQMTGQGSAGLGGGGVAWQKVMEGTLRKR